MDFVSNVGRREQVQVNEVGRWVEIGNKSLNGYEHNVLFRNCGGGDPQQLRFEDAGFLSGADCIEDGRAVAAFDLENDGDVDLIVQNFGKPPCLLVNQGEHVGHWLELRLRGPRPNGDAIGARVVAEIGSRKFLREVAVSAGYLAGQSTQLFFGFGDAKVIDRMTVYWPGPGHRTTVLTNVAVDQRLQLALDGSATSDGPATR